MILQQIIRVEDIGTHNNICSVPVTSYTIQVVQNSTYQTLRGEILGSNKTFFSLTGVRKSLSI